MATTHNGQAPDSWIQVQKKTFTKWCNSHVVKRWGSQALIINDIGADWESGILLMQLVSALYGIPMPARYNQHPKMRVHMIDNVNQAMDMLENQAKVKTNFLKNTQFVDHDLKMMLGMVWSIILDYQIKGISVEELNAKEGLLLWCQKKTAGYRDVKVENFTTSFQDGMAFCALLHAHRPDLINFDQRDKKNALENLEMAFNIAEKELGIPKLLDPSDLLDQPRPDERSVMTYVSEWFHYFASRSQFEVAGRRIGKVVDMTKQNDALRSDYLEHAKRVAEWTKETTTHLNEREFGNTVAAVQEKLTALSDYKKNEKPPKLADRLACEQLFNNLAVKLRTLGRPAFVPPAGLAVADLQKLWEDLETAERERETALLAELQRRLVLEREATAFFFKAAALLQWTAKKEGFFNATASEVFDSEDQVRTRLSMITAFDEDFAGAGAKRLEEVNALGKHLIENGYERSSEVQEKIDALSNVWKTLADTSAKRKEQLEAEAQRQATMDTARHEYAKEVTSLDRWLKDVIEDSKDTHFGNNLEAVTAYEATLTSSRQELEEEYSKRKATADAAAAKLAELQVSDFRYTVLTIESIEQRKKQLDGLLDARVTAYNEELSRQKAMEEKRLEFAKLAQEFVDFLAAQKKEIIAVTGEPEEKIDTVTKLYNSGTQGEELLAALKKVDEEALAMGIAHNKHTDLSYKLLESRWGSFQAFVKNYLASLTDDLESKKQAETRRAEVEKRRHIENLKIECAQLAGVLNQAFEATSEQTGAPLIAKAPADVTAMQEKLAAAKTSKGEVVPPNLAKLGEISNQLATEGVTENPLAELSLTEANEKNASADQAIAQRETELAAELEKQKTIESLCIAFAEKAEAFNTSLDAVNSKISNTTGTPEEQIVALDAINSDITPLRAQLEELQKANQAVIDAGVTENTHTKLTFVLLEAKNKQVCKAAEDKRRVLASTVEQAKGSKVSEEQMKELKEAFSYFDKDGNGIFTPSEFKACVGSLGEDLSDEAVTKVFTEYGTNGQMNFDGYVRYMVNRLSDKTDPSEIIDSFNTISGGKPFVTDQQIKQYFPDKAEYLMANMPAGPEPNTFDFKKYTEDIFSR